jgi:hypothetical protein
MKKLIVIAVLFAAIVTGAFAQSGEITDYMFGLPGGNFMEPQWYVYSGFEKFYIQAGFDDPNLAKLGFATKVGEMYIGVSYEGSLFNQADVWDYTEETIDVTPPPNPSTSPFEGKTIKTYGIPALDGSKRPNHNIGVLFGIQDIGIKLTVETDYQIFDLNEDAIVGTNNYKSYKAEYGDVSPSLKFGFAKDLTEKGIRPSVELVFSFHTDSIQTNYYEAGTTDPITGKTSYPTHESKRGFATQGTDNFAIIGVKLNLGEYIIYSKDNFSFSADFDYAFGTTICGENEYTYNSPNPTTGAIDIKTFKETGRFDDQTTGVFHNDVSVMVHGIEPSVKVIWDSEKVGLGAKLHLPILITDGKETVNNIYIETDPTKPTYGNYTLNPDTSTKETIFAFKPELKLGGVYRIVPDKFNINMGATIGLSSVGVKTVEETDEVQYINNDPTQGKNPDYGKSTTTVSQVTTGTSSSFSVGASLFITKNVILDVKTGVVDANSLYIFGGNSTDPLAAIPGSLTYFTALLLMLSF